MATVVVQGLRASAASADLRRRAAEGVVDAVVAADLHRLPDLSVADAIQRIPGVQVARDRGEASTFAVRGLIQVDTLLNGREVFTAGGGRTLDLADVASEMLAGIDVLKTASPDRPEGGIGGTVDLRTRRPLDVEGDATLGSLRHIHGDLVRRAATQGSLLVSRRRAAPGGTIGWMANVFVQQRAWREDQQSLGLPQLRRDIVPGSTVVIPAGTSETVSVGTRRRTGGSLVVQGRRDDGTAWTLEAHQSELRTLQDSHQINVSAGTGFDPASVVLGPDGEDVQRIAWTRSPASLLGFARDTLDRTRQLAGHLRVPLGPSWTLDLDASRTRSRSQLFFSGPVLAATAARFEQDLRTVPPSTGVADASWLDPAAWRYTGVAYRFRPFDGGLDAVRADATWNPPGDGPLQRLAFGWRSSLREAGNAPGLVFGDVTLASPIPGTAGGLLPNPFGDFLGGTTPAVTTHPVADLSDARDPVALRRRLGITASLPVAGNPLGVWRVRERTDAAYLRTELQADPAGPRALLGLRIVQVTATTDGTRSVPDLASTAPLAVRNRQLDLLPSASAVWPLTQGWQGRVAASRTLSRPGFDQLSPSLTLLRNSVDASLNTGSAGNPELQPVRSRNLDLALESPADRALAGTATLFAKQVDGFVASLSRPETWDGVVYQVTRPVNSDPARIAGLELAGRLAPQAWRWLGVQANATWVHSRTPDARLGTGVPLQNLSRRSGNLILTAEQGAFGARLAWNGRSAFLSGVSQIVGLGAQPVVTRGHSWLDAALTWRPLPAVQLSLEGGNLLRTRRSTVIGDPAQPSGTWMNDRQWALSLQVRP